MYLSKIFNRQPKSIDELFKKAAANNNSIIHVKMNLACKNRFIGRKYIEGSLEYSAGNLRYKKVYTGANVKIVQTTLLHILKTYRNEYPNFMIRFNEY